MKKILILSIALLSTPAFAQQQPTEYTIKVKPADLDIISEGLQTQPFGKVFPLINSLRDQIIAQQPKPAAAPVEVPKVEPVK